MEVDETQLSVGMKVAIYHEEIYAKLKYTPLIGEIIEMSDEGGTWLKVSLWRGSYSGSWICPAKPSVEWVTSDAVILYDFEFTAKQKLMNTTKDKLKSLYATYIC